MTDGTLSRIKVICGDITQLDVDVIVNAANETLLGGGGVDGAIHRAAGPGLLAECRTLGGCPTGHARITDGFRLKARHVIHTVGPVYQDGNQGEPALLRSCYEQSLKLSLAKALDSIAFPCISTGIFGYPKHAARDVAIDTVLTWLHAHDRPRQVVFCCFTQADMLIYQERLANYVHP